jgi:hypothetical protein
MLDDQRHDCPTVGHTELQTRRKTSLFFALLLGTQSSSHYCNYILSALALLPAMNHL